MTAFAESMDAFRIFVSRYGLPADGGAIHQFVPGEDDETRCKHCEGYPHNLLHWSI